MFLHLSVSADLPQDPLIANQRSLMFQLIGGCVQNGHTPANFRQMDRESNPCGLFAAEHANQVCYWTGVQCADDLVDRIHWTRFGDPRLTLHNIDIRFFPPTLRHIEVQHLHYVTKMSNFRVRYLPRRVRFVDLTSGDFKGSLDLRNLPQNIVHLHLKGNRLEGAVDLTCLPENFVALDARENCIHTVVVDNESLPKSLESIQVGGHKSFKRRVKLVIVNGKTVDDRVYVEEFPRPGQRRRVT